MYAKKENIAERERDRERERARGRVRVREAERGERDNLEGCQEEGRRRGLSKREISREGERQREGEIERERTEDSTWRIMQKHTSRQVSRISTKTTTPSSTGMNVIEAATAPGFGVSYIPTALV